MLSEDLEFRLRSGIKGGRGFHSLREDLVWFNSVGGTRDEARVVLKEILESVDEDADDLVRDLLDVVEGWCVSRLRVW